MSVSQLHGTKFIWIYIQLSFTPLIQNLCTSFISEFHFGRNFCASFFGSVLRAIHLVEKRHHFVVDVVLIAHEICKRNDNSAKNVDSSSARPCIVKYLIWNASKAINFTLLDNITATLRLLHIFSDFRLSRQIALWFWIHHIMFKHKTNSVYNL